MASAAAPKASVEDGLGGNRKLKKQKTGEDAIATAERLDQELSAKFSDLLEQEQIRKQCSASGREVSEKSGGNFDGTSSIARTTSHRIGEGDSVQLLQDVVSTHRELRELLADGVDPPGTTSLLAWRLPSPHSRDDRPPLPPVPSRASAKP